MIIWTQFHVARIPVAGWWPLEPAQAIRVDAFGQVFQCQIFRGEHGLDRTWDEIGRGIARYIRERYETSQREGEGK